MTGSFKVQLINMGTRAAAFQAKLRCLHDYHLRLLHNIVPAPSGIDIANTIKYFSQTFLTVLKDVPSSPHQIIKDPSQDHIRMSSYPNLEYGNLYNALAMLLDVAPNIQFGLNAFGKAVLQCLGCILPFLDKDLIDNLPYLTASAISVLPSNLHQDVINSLCFYILPFTITRQSVFEDQECHSCQSVSAVIMLVFQYSNNPAHHCQLLECLLALKQNVVKDLLCVIAYGTAASRSSAAKLLFYYWPAFNANLFDRRGLLCKFTNDLIPFVCQRELCPNAGNAEATKVCYDHNISITYAPDCPPPLYLCIECANEIHREHPNQTFGDILHPMAQVSMICENKNCRSTEKSAVSICFSTECASYNGNHPIRYCTQCHGNRHNSRRGGDHIVHRSLPPAWQMDAEMQTYMVEAIISLLREAKPINFEPAKDVADPRVYPYNIPQDNISLDERQLLGRYGIWLLVGRCTPTPDTPVEILCRLISILFHWFHVTAYSYDGTSTIESTVEKLKIEHVCGWLKDIGESHYKEFISCLLPHPPEYARVGGHWDTLASRTCHLKEGLQRLICLVPYEIITSEIWDIVMPHWMEAITNDVPEKELVELKVVLSKILDPEMSPLGFDAKTMYNFVAIRFENTSAKVQEQALKWLQILSKLKVLIPLHQLFAMFGDGVRIMKHEVQQEMSGKEKQHDKNMKFNDQDDGGGSGGGGGIGGSGGVVDNANKNVNADKDELVEPLRRSSISPVVEDDSGNTSAMSDDEMPTMQNTSFSTDAEHNLTCCILMLDILLKQLELQDVEKHMGIHTHVCENVCRLLKCMVTAARVGLGSHTCATKSAQISECAYCEASIMWHQLSTKLVQYMAPENLIRPPDPPIEEFIDDEKSNRKSPPESDKGKERERDVSLSMAPLPIPLGPLAFGGPVPVPVPHTDPHSISERHDSDLARFIHATDEIMTATVETVSDHSDLVSHMPSEKVVSAMARSVTLSDVDVATATVEIAKPQQYVGPQSSASVGTAHNANTTSVIGSGGGGGDDSLNNKTEDGENYWPTSVGKFNFPLDSLPQPLQYIHQLLTELPIIEKPDTLYYMLQCLSTLALHGDALAKAARDQRGFFIWLQENLLIKNLWDLCNAEHSHISESSVPLLLHCITLPLGSDVFWRIIHEEFHASDWRTRFRAVERVTVITRFMDSTPLRTEVGLQTSLATAFCHLIASMDDSNVHVAQRATLYLGTIHDKAIQSLLFCLECQFDMFIVDRPVILQSLYQLHNSLSDRKVLSWDFFLNRFDTLFVEAQITLEKSGDILYLRDLKNSENGSEVLSNKISKAREALNQSDTSGSMAKTLSASFGPKWPYKRTMSAPASIIPRQESKVEKEKVYNRQISAPILKRKSSRFGLGQFLSSGTISSNAVASSHLPSTSYSLHYHQAHHLSHSHYQHPHPHPYHHHHHQQPQQQQPHNPSHSNISSAPLHNQAQSLSGYAPGIITNITTATTTSFSISTSTTTATTTNQLNSFIASQQHQQQQQQQLLQHMQQQQQQQQQQYYCCGGGAMTMGAPDGHLHSFGGPNDDSNITECLHRIIDLEESDKETIHLLVFLFMQFLSRSDQAYPTDEKPLCKIQKIVLSHLYLLLGYSQIDKNFHVSSTRLRSSAVFNVFLANLPQVLDQNHLMGWRLIQTAFQVLLYAPSLTTPNITGEIQQNIPYTFTLWYLESNVRKNWLMSAVVIMYKYQYTQPPYSGHINNIIRIMLNSLDAHFHQCKRIPATVIMDFLHSSRSRDLSQPSLGEHSGDICSPPPSPLYTLEGGSGGGGGGSGSGGGTNNGGGSSRTKPSGIFTQKSGQPTFRKYQDSSLDADETESELVAIPESDLSDSTLHGSAPGSFDDPMPETLPPLFPDLKNRTAAQMTSVNLAQLAMSTLGVSTDDKKDGKINSENTRNLLKKSSTQSVESTKTITSQSKCSLQEGVRMMVTPSMFMTGGPSSATSNPLTTNTTTTTTAYAKEKATLNPPVNVQRAMVVSQRGTSSTTQMLATSCYTNFGLTPQTKISDENSKSNGTHKNRKHDDELQQKPSPRQQLNALPQNILGRQKRIIEPSISSTFVSPTASISPNNDDRSSFGSNSKSSINGKTKFNKNFDSHPIEYGSPDSPMSKMNIMSNPSEDIPDNMLISPKSISKLEFPVPERLLPIGHQTEPLDCGLSGIADKVREALAIPDLSHLKHGSCENLRGPTSYQYGHSTSPRRLMKQVALDSPTAHNLDNDLHCTMIRSVTHEFNRDTMNNNLPIGVRDQSLSSSSYLTQKQRYKKMGGCGPPFVPSLLPPRPELTKIAGAWLPTWKDEQEDESINQFNNGKDDKQSINRIGDDCLCHRCSECGILLEEYSDEEIGIMVITLGTFIHREPALAAPFLPEIITTVTKFAMHSTFPWQYDNSTHLPGGSQSVAHQFIRCVLHQLAPNGVFVQMFLTQANEKQRLKYFKSISKALVDFQELNPTSPVVMLADSLNTKKTLPLDTLPVSLRNMGEYLQSIPADAGIGSNSWSQVVQGVETLFRRLILHLHNFEEPDYLLDIMVSIIKIPGVSKGILEPFTKAFSYCIQNCTLKHKVLNDLCFLSSRAFSKERDKHQICRQLVFELVQALKFKIKIPDSNLLLLVGFVLQDAGGLLPSGTVSGLPETPPIYTSNASDCMRQYLNDIMDFLADFHTLSKIHNLKSNNLIIGGVGGGGTGGSGNNTGGSGGSGGISGIGAGISSACILTPAGMNDDTFGGILKGAIAQYIALEMSRGNSKDNKTVARYLPWLYNSPSSIQQGPKEFTECVAHMRLISWLLLGALTHTALLTNKNGIIGQHGASVHYHLHHPGHSSAQPVPQEASCHIADHIQVIFAGFAEQSKTSVLHMSSLFHAFTLCQLWTVYLEHLACSTSPTSESHNVTMGILFEFWGKVTPSILNLVTVSKVLSEMVNLHFVSLLEALKETRSTILAKLLPLWSPVLSSITDLSSTLHVRLQNCRDFSPLIDEQIEVTSSIALLKWLDRLQYKMAQIELQSSTASQFYSM